MSEISDERFVLEGTALRVFCRAPKPILAAALRTLEGSVVKTTPAMPLAGEFVCWFDLGGLARGQTYEIVARFGAGEERPLGRRTARARRMLARAGGRSAGARREVLAASRFAHDEQETHAWLYADLGDEAVRLRLSEADDIDAFLAAAPKAPGRGRVTNRFSVVSAVYNVEKYLDDYFTSLTKQTLDFRAHVELIVVDDGSTDRSAKIIRRWQKKFPKNIVYIRKENGGPGSARNLGLARASHDWVTFVDPDDFVADDYFAVVSDAIERHRDDAVAMIVCNLVRFIEKTATRSNTQPLRYRFASGERVVAIGALGRDIQTSVAYAFFRKDRIDDDRLRFDERISPNFEDTDFVGRYLLRRRDSQVLFLPGAIYNYRIRDDKSSLIQTGQFRPDYYSDQIRYGCLGLLKAARDINGTAPRYVQNSVLYALSWHISRIAGDSASLSFLTDAQRREYGDLLTETFALIDADVVDQYDLTPFPFSHRLGILNLFKNIDPPRQLVAVTQHDPAKKLVCAVCWSRNQTPSVAFQVDGREVAPVFHKSRGVDFLGAPFVWEHIAWVPLSGAQVLAVTIDGLRAEISAGGAEGATTIDLAGIRSGLATPVPAEGRLPPHVRQLRQMARSPKAIADFKDAWLFMDRDSVADDSAERLYRYVRQQAPEINAYFILQRGSPDWARLAADGFRLLPFNEAEHGIALLNASHLISSQADHYVVGYLGQAEFGDLIKYRYVFLNHGVIRDDISRWLNTVAMDCFVTSSPAEYELIVGDGSNYRFTAKEVVLTGMPRHDALLDGPVRDGHTVIVMPTWRSSLTGMAEGVGNARAANKAFFESEFAQRWKSFLHSERFLESVERAGWRVIFLPHPNIEQYLDYFDLPDSVELKRFGEGASLHQTFRDLSLFVTDYSSKAFDIAYLQKPVIYYQFDPDVFFGGGHMSRAGYLDYERDGFGPVVHEEADLVAAVESMLAAGGAQDAVYRQRAERTFPFRDGKCSERVFRAIKALSEPL